MCYVGSNNPTNNEPFHYMCLLTYKVMVSFQIALGIHSFYI